MYEYNKIKVDKNMNKIINNLIT